LRLLPVLTLSPTSFHFGAPCTLLSSCQNILLFSQLHLTNKEPASHSFLTLLLSGQGPDHPSRFLIPISTFFLLIIKSGLHPVPKTWNSQRKKKRSNVQCHHPWAP
jgi:hypothetical protein